AAQTNPAMTSACFARIILALAGGHRIGRCDDKRRASETPPCTARGNPRSAARLSGAGLPLLQHVARMHAAQPDSVETGASRFASRASSHLPASLRRIVSV